MKTISVVSIGALLLVQSALSANVTVKSIQCSDIPIASEECLIVTSSDGKILYAGLKSFGDSDQAFTGTLYTASGKAIADSDVSLTKHDEDDVDNTTNAFVILINPEDEALELECNLSTGECKEPPKATGQGNKGIVDEELTLPSDVLEEDASLDRQSKTLPAQGFKLKTQVLYDSAFAQKFGQDKKKITNAINRILVHAQSFFKLKTLTTKIEIDTTGLPYKPLSTVHNANEQAINALIPIVDGLAQQANSFTVLSYRNNEDGTVGLAWGSSTCTSQKGYRVNIAEYFQNDLTTGATVAHEIGHNLGMKHDFNNGNPKDHRYSSKGKACSKVGGVMDYYGKTTDKWTDCSIEDFTAYYNKVRTWCLPLLTGSGDETATTRKPTDTTTNKPTDATTNKPTSSTKAPTSTCKDELSFCRRYKRHCSPYVTLNGRPIFETCKKTCGKCPAGGDGATTTKAPSSTCKDEDHFCQFYKRHCNPYVTLNGRPIFETCKKTCGKC